MLSEKNGNAVAHYAYARMLVENTHMSAYPTQNNVYAQNFFRGEPGDIQFYGSSVSEPAGDQSDWDNRNPGSKKSDQHIADLNGNFGETITIPDEFSVSGEWAREISQPPWIGYGSEKLIERNPSTSGVVL